MNPPKGKGSSKKNFGSISQQDLPSGRKGKHFIFLAQVLQDLESLETGRAMKIPLAEFTGTVSDMRSAISRATKKKNIEVLTSSDDDFFYVWRPSS